MFDSWIENQIKLKNLWKASKTCKYKVQNFTGLWVKKYYNLLSRAKRQNIHCNLTFNEYLYKAYEVGLVSPTQISTRGDVNKIYNLSRYKDKGAYTKENCRFITRMENIKEKDSHFDMSIHNKKQNQKRVNNKTHHLLNTKPWCSNKASNNSLKIWFEAEKTYKIWNKDKTQGKRTLSRKVNTSSTGVINNMISYFKKGWIPHEDNEWLDFKKDYKKTVKLL